MLPFPEYITQCTKTLQFTNLDLFFSFLEIMLWLQIILGVTISRDPLLLTDKLQVRTDLLTAQHIKNSFYKNKFLLYL